MNRTFQRTAGIAVGSIGLALGVMAPASASTHQQCGLLGCLLSTGTGAVQKVVGGVTGALVPHPAQPHLSQPQTAPSQPSGPPQSSGSSGSPGSAHPNGQPAPQAPAAAGPALPTQPAPQQSSNSGSAATVKISQYPPVSTESRSAQRQWAAPGAAAGHSAAKQGGQTGQVGQSAMARFAQNAVGRDLSVELAVLVMIGGAGVVLYRSQRNAAQTPRYVGRRRHNGPRPQQVRPMA